MTPPTLWVMLTDPEKVSVLWMGHAGPPRITGPVLPVTMMLPSSDSAQNSTPPALEAVRLHVIDLR